MMLTYHRFLLLFFIASAALETKLLLCEGKSKVSKSTNENAPSTKSIEVHGHKFRYYARLDDNLVHAFGVKRMWSVTRQDILDELTKKNQNFGKGDPLEVAIDEHDPVLKKRCMLDLTHKISEMVVSEMFTTIFQELPVTDQVRITSFIFVCVLLFQQYWLTPRFFIMSDQKFVMNEKSAGTLIDLSPKCEIMLDSYNQPTTCAVQFHSLESVYATSIDLNVTLHTKSMELPDAELFKRINPDPGGKTRPIEHTSIEVDGIVMAPNRIAKKGVSRVSAKYKNKRGRAKAKKDSLSIDTDFYVSEASINAFEEKINYFLSVLLPIIKVDDMGVATYAVRRKEEWKKMMDDYSEYERKIKDREEKDKMRKEIDFEMFTAFVSNYDSDTYDALKQEQLVQKKSNKNKVKERLIEEYEREHETLYVQANDEEQDDGKPREVKDGVDGLDEFLLSREMEEDHIESMKQQQYYGTDEL